MPPTPEESKSTPKDPEYLNDLEDCDPTYRQRRQEQPREDEDSPPPYESEETEKLRSTRKEMNSAPSDQPYVDYETWTHRHDNYVDVKYLDYQRKQLEKQAEREEREWRAKATPQQRQARLDFDTVSDDFYWKFDECMKI
jgi:hypothetical protein